MVELLQGLRVVEGTAFVAAPLAGMTLAQMRADVICFGQDFPTADERRIMIVALTQRQWRKLLAVTGLGEAAAALGSRLGLDLARKGNRFRARGELAALFAPWFAARRVEEFQAAFDQVGVTWSEFRSFARAVAEDSGLSPDNPLFASVEPPRPAPELGEHTDEILAGIVGLSGAEIARLHDADVVAGPRR
jgi:2-methylfumaryl-CoA isomerase